MFFNLFCRDRKYSNDTYVSTMAPDRRYTRNYCNVKIVDKRDALFSWSTTLAAVIARNNQISFVADRREIVHHNGTGCAPLLNRNSLRPGYNRKYLPRTGHGCEIVFTSRIGISFGRCYSRGGKAKSAASGIFLRLFTYEFLRAC